MALLGCRPFGPGPSRSALFSFRNVRHPSVTLAPLLLLLETNTEAEVVVTVAGGGVVALSRTQARPVAAPGTTPSDPKRARCRSGGIHHRVASGISRLVPVRGPLPDISMHIEKAQRVGRIIAHITGLAQTTDRVISPCCINVIPPRIHRRRTCPAGIFPLRLGGKNIGPTSGDVCRLLGIQTGQENLSISPTTFSTGRFGLFGHSLGVALRLSVLPVITASYWACVTSYLPR